MKSENSLHIAVAQIAFGLGVVIVLLADSGLLDWLGHFQSLRLPSLASQPSLPAPVQENTSQNQTLPTQKLNEFRNESEKELSLMEMTPEEIQTKALKEYAKTVRRSLYSVENSILDQRKEVGGLLDRLKAHRRSVNDKKRILDTLQQEIEQIDLMKSNQELVAGNRISTKRKLRSDRRPSRLAGDAFSPLSYLEVVQNLIAKTDREARFEKQLFADLIFTRFILSFDQVPAKNELTPLGHLQLFTLIDGLTRLNKREVLITHFDGSKKQEQLADAMIESINSRFGSRVTANLMPLNQIDMGPEFSATGPEIWVMETDLPSAISMREVGE